MGLSLQVKHHAFALDCADPLALAEFYGTLLGWRVEASADEPDWVEALPPEDAKVGFNLAFQQVPNYRPPVWPDGAIPQQAHLDFYVDSLEESGAIAIAAGAKKHAYQPSETGSWVVYEDPAGHLFCLCGS